MSAKADPALDAQLILVDRKEHMAQPWLASHVNRVLPTEAPEVFSDQKVRDEPS